MPVMPDVHCLVSLLLVFLWLPLRDEVTRKLSTKATRQRTVTDVFQSRSSLSSPITRACFILRLTSILYLPNQRFTSLQKVYHFTEYVQYLSTFMEVASS